MTYSPPPSVARVPPRAITPWSFESLGATIAAFADPAPATTAWSQANQALFVPFSIPFTKTAKKMFLFNGSAVSGNVDVGIYNDAGTRLVSAGSTAQAGTSAIQEFDITDTALPGSQLLYMAVVLDNTTGAVNSRSGGADEGKLRGILTMASAFPLPSTATFASPSTNFRMPIFGIAFETAY